MMLSQTWQRNNFMESNPWQYEPPGTRDASNRSRKSTPRSGLEVASSAAKRKQSQDTRPYWSRAMRVKLFSQGVSAPIQSLEDDINEFLESQRPHVTL